MAKKPEIMTDTGGNPIADNQNSITAGPRGPLTITHEIVQRPRSGAVKSKFVGARS
jgi:catalase